MKLTPAEFKQLQLEWYRELSLSGFEDIEEFKRGTLVLKKYPERSGHPIYKDCEWKNDYFATMGGIVNDERTVFRNKIDKVILKLHVCGNSHIEIVEILKDLGIWKHRNTVRNIIWRYQWKWKLRKNPPKYLSHNRKKQPTQS